MLSKSFIASIFLLASISAHTGVGPVLGVQGLLIPNDVQLRATDVRDFNGASNVVRNAAADGVTSSVDSRAVGDNKAADKKKDKKKKDKKKKDDKKKAVTPATDSRAAADDPNDQKGEAGKAKKDDKKKDKKKKGGKKKGKKSVSPLTDSRAADDEQEKQNAGEAKKKDDGKKKGKKGKKGDKIKGKKQGARSWSSLEMGDFA